MTTEHEGKLGTTSEETMSNDDEKETLLPREVLTEYHRLRYYPHGTKSFMRVILPSAN